MASILHFRPSINPELLTLREAAKVSGKSQVILKLLIQAGQLRYLRSGLAIYIRRSDAQRLCASGR